MVLDLIFLILFVYFLIRGYNKGIVVALFSFCALFIGIIGALKISGTLANLFVDKGTGGKWIPIIAYILVFVGIVWLVKMGASLIQKSMDAIALGWINRLIGAALYGFLICFIFSTVLWMFDKMNVMSSETKSASHIYPVVSPIAPLVFSYLGDILPFIKHIIADLNAFFDHVNGTITHVGTPR